MQYILDPVLSGLPILPLQTLLCQKCLKYVHDTWPASSFNIRPAVNYFLLCYHFVSAHLESLNPKFAAFHSNNGCPRPHPTSEVPLTGKPLVLVPLAPRYCPNVRIQVIYIAAKGRRPDCPRRPAYLRSLAEGQPTLRYPSHKS